MVELEALGLRGSGNQNEENRRSVFDLTALSSMAAELEIKDIHITSVLQAVVNNPKMESMQDVVAKLPQIPMSLKRLLVDRFVITTSKIVEKKESDDKSTLKLLIELSDGNLVETVIMRYGDNDFVHDDTALDKTKTRVVSLVEYVATASRHGPRTTSKITTKRSTVCVSSQVGCRMGCGFCATGTMGLIHSLKTFEILEQVFHSVRQESIRNIVFMGMGEPLDNYDAVVESVAVMTNPRFFSLSPHHITVSTVGLHKEIRNMIDDCPNVNLALSLHAPNQKLREFVVPSSAKYNLDDILDASHAFVMAQKSKTNRASRQSGLLLQYCLIEGVNDSEENALEVCDLIERWPGMKEYSRLNIIPYNKTETPMANKHDFTAPNRETVLGFYKSIKNRGVKVFVRQLNGADIDGACGQLVVGKNRKALRTTVSEKREIDEGYLIGGLNSLLGKGSEVWSMATSVWQEHPQSLATGACLVAIGVCLLYRKRD
eukprot:GHVH01000222.1.p1 GENE.GHVH01000222.1~~GHVH01000222.1.p1  ORF type:complete len:488 (-),score=68.21 GHVH01000222.1:70-1533(-)